MLGKLIKYDLKSTSKILILVHGFLLLSALFMRLFITGQLQAESMSEGSELLLTLTILLYTLLIMGASFATSIIIAVRFYKNLFSDEGYLTNTLPVKRGTHLLAKTISGGIWAVIDLILLFLSIYIVAFPPMVMELYQEHESEILEALGFTGAYALPSTPVLLLFLAAVCILSGLSSVAMIYASIALGQLFESHRVVGAVACYFAISTVFSMISYATTMIIGLSTNAFITTDGSTAMNLGRYIFGILEFSTVWAVITGIILYIVTWRLLDRKLNLP